MVEKTSQHRSGHVADIESSVGQSVDPRCSIGIVGQENGEHGVVEGGSVDTVKNAEKIGRCKEESRGGNIGEATKEKRASTEEEKIQQQDHSDTKTFGTSTDKRSCDEGGKMEDPKDRSNLGDTGSLQGGLDGKERSLQGANQTPANEHTG